MLKSLLALIVLAAALSLPAEAATTRRTGAHQTKAQRQSHFMRSQHEQHRPSHHHPHKTPRRPWH